MTQREDQRRHVSADARKHILQGDETGGGHRRKPGEPHPLQGLWNEIREHFDLLLSDDSLAISTGVHDEVVHFLQHNELGLAFDSLLFGLKGRTNLTEAQRLSVDKIGSLMDLDPASWSDITTP